MDQGRDTEKVWKIFGRPIPERTKEPEGHGEGGQKWSFIGEVKSKI